MPLFASIRSLLADTRGSLAVETIGAALVVFAAAVTLFAVFPVAKGGISGIMDTRTIARNAIINDSCSMIGVFEGRSSTIGLRASSISSYDCDIEIEGETAVRATERFWTIVPKGNQAPFQDYNATQRDAMPFNAVHTNQKTNFLSGGVSTRLIGFQTSVFVPSDEAWNFYDPAWAEGHDKVFWAALTEPQQDLFPRVYPSALDRSAPERMDRRFRELEKFREQARDDRIIQQEAPQETLRDFEQERLDRIAQKGEEACNEFIDQFLEGPRASGGVAGSSKKEDNGDRENSGNVTGSVTIFDGELKKVKNPSATDAYSRCGVHTVGGAELRGKFGIDFSDWDIDLGLEVEVTPYKYEQVTIYDAKDLVIVKSLELLPIEVGAGVETDKELGAKARVAVARGELKICKQSKPSNCVAVGASVLEGGAEIEIDEDGVESDIDAGYASVSLSGSGEISFGGYTFNVDGEIQAMFGPAGVDFDGAAKVDPGRSEGMADDILL